MSNNGDSLNDARLVLGSCLDVLPTLAAGSVDCVVSDPPYPGVKRSYGTWTEEEWFALMRPVVAEVRRILKPKGSAVFVLQPNSEKAGKMRPWLWDFIGWVCREWNLVQDAWWWNTSALPMGGATECGLMRGSLKACVWAGPQDCYRNQTAVLWTESDGNRSKRTAKRFDYDQCPSRVRSTTEGARDNHARLKGRAGERGGSTPFNVLPFGSDGRHSGGTHGHGASTPMQLMRWWTKYLCPPGGTVLDPFSGSGTGALAALAEGRNAIGIERDPGYHEIATRRLAEVKAS